MNAVPQLLFEIAPRVPSGAFAMTDHQLRDWELGFHDVLDLSFHLVREIVCDWHGKRYPGYVLPGSELGRMYVRGWFAGRRSKA